MTLEQRYRELPWLKEEINQRLEEGTDDQVIRNLMRYLAQYQAYPKLKSVDNQLNILGGFFDIWLKEKKKLPDLGIETNIFYNVSSLNDVEQKYQRIWFCCLRIENAVPDEYIEQALQWLAEDRVSGLAVGKFIVSGTWKREDNFLHIAQLLRQKGDFLNALLLMQYANETYPGREKLLLGEADIWLDGRQYGKALELLMGIGKPSQCIRELIMELRQVAGDG